MSTHPNMRTPLATGARRLRRASMVTLAALAGLAVALPAHAQSRGGNDKKEAAAAAPRSRPAPAAKPAPAAQPQRAAAQPQRSAQPQATQRQAAPSRQPAASTPSRQPVATQPQAAQPVQSRRAAATSPPTRQQPVTKPGAPAVQAQQSRPTQPAAQVPTAGGSTPTARTRPTSPLAGNAPPRSPQAQTTRDAQPARGGIDASQRIQRPSTEPTAGIAPRQRPGGMWSNSGTYSPSASSGDAVRSRSRGGSDTGSAAAPLQRSRGGDDPVMREYQPLRRDGSGQDLRRGQYASSPDSFEFQRPLNREPEHSGALLRERYRSPGSSLVPSADVHHHHHHYYDRHHHGHRHSRPRTSLSIHLGFGSYWGYPYWYHRPSYWHYYDPWCAPVVYYRPYRPVYWWDCDPWPVRSSTTVIISSGFRFSNSASVRYVYSSSALVPAATVYEPVYISSSIYSPPPTTVVTPILLSPQPVAAAVETYPAPASEMELRTVTDRQLADTYMRLGDLESAIRVYAAHTSRHPGDVQALRSLGLALIADEQVQSGVEYVQRAYRIDPLLAQRRIPLDLLDQRMFDHVLDLTTRHAAERNLAGSWLTVAALMQSQGRNDSARSALERARAAGLESSIVEWMLAETPIGQ